MLECVVNISEGRRPEVVDRLAGAVTSRSVLDVHADADHNRSVFTLAGQAVEEAARQLAAAAVATLDLREHSGVHPRIGVVDVVPFVPLAGTPWADAVVARDRFAGWFGGEVGVPCFLYGRERSLPEIRRSAWASMPPDTGPPEPHPTAGGCAVGARGVLVAYNVWLETDDLGLARRLAAAVRGAAVRALGLTAGGCVQVSMNLVDPMAVGPAVAFDAVRDLAGREGVRVRRAELVGLLPAEVLAAVAEDRWEQLDIDPDRTIEARLS